MLSFYRFYDSVYFICNNFDGIRLKVLNWWSHSIEYSNFCLPSTKGMITRCTKYLIMGSCIAAALRAVRELLVTQLAVASGSIMRSRFRWDIYSDLNFTHPPNIYIHNKKKTFALKYNFKLLWNCCTELRLASTYLLLVQYR